MNAKIDLHQHLIFIKLQNSDTADMKCFSVFIVLGTQGPVMFLCQTFRYENVTDIM